jgi:hypothetical protein
VTAHRGPVPFLAHIELLQFFLAHRDDIVESIQGILNAQRQPLEYLRDGSLLSREFEDCFFALSGVTSSHSHLRGQLDDAHQASGFRPRAIAGLYNNLVDPAEMMMRAFHLWRETRWPGRNGRVHYAHTLFNMYVMRCLELLSLRLWDDPSISASDRLSQLQIVLDRLWKSAPHDQPVLLRDARWLIQLAQSPATDDLGAYFEIAQRLAESFAEEDRIEIHRAGVRMTGGHLRSQLRYHSTKKGVSLDEQGLILSARDSNALDFALLIQELVPLLAAYEHAWHSGDDRKRFELADAICQGISSDPELFVNRVELLGAYSMIEHLFITTDSEGHAVYTAMGRRHVQLVHEYQAHIGRVAKPLSEDCRHFQPIEGTYSPYGVLYGFTTNLIEHMAFKALQPDAVTRFSLEDVFASGDDSSGKLAWVSGWRKLPHLRRDVAALFDYPQQFAEAAFNRNEHALKTRASNDQSNAGVRTGRLFVAPAGNEATTSLIPELPVRYLRSSDTQLVAAQKAEAHDETELLTDRREGKFVLSYRTSGGWVAIPKAILTEVLGAGRDALIVGLPPEVAAALNLMCPGLVVLARNDATAK